MKTKKREKPVGKVSKRLTEAARAAFDKAFGGEDRSLVGQDVAVKGWKGKGTVMAQWKEGDHTIVTVKLN